LKMLAEFYRVEQCTEKRVTDIGFSSFAVRALVGDHMLRMLRCCLSSYLIACPFAKIFSFNFC
ncbi:hypothetical protein T4C_12906, partial [Trichinella pseudospiralis]